MPADACEVSVPLPALVLNPLPPQTPASAVAAPTSYHRPLPPLSQRPKPKEEEEEEDDPLDAFMNGLAEVKKKVFTSISRRMGVLDIMSSIELMTHNYRRDLDHFIG